jgi:hypothetical protein
MVFEINHGAIIRQNEYATAMHAIIFHFNFNMGVDLASYYYSSLLWRIFALIDGYVYFSVVHRGIPKAWFASPSYFGLA